MTDLTIIISFYIITKLLSLLIDGKTESWTVTIFSYITIIISAVSIIGIVFNQLGLTQS